MQPPDFIQFDDRFHGGVNNKVQGATRQVFFYVVLSIEYIYCFRLFRLVLKAEYGWLRVRQTLERAHLGSTTT